VLGRKDQLTLSPGVVTLKLSKFKAYPNKEIHEIVKKAVQPFIKEAKWGDKEVPPYELFLCDQNAQTFLFPIPMDEGNSDLTQKHGMSFAVRWTNGGARLAEGRFAVDVSAEGLDDDNRSAKSGIGVDACLDGFTRSEVLQQSDMWYCSKFTKHQRATKKFDLWRLPEILIIHLKRFQYNSIFREKISTFVDFPIEGLNLSKWLVNDDEKSRAVYDLYAVSNHFGGMGGGHYTAFAKNLLNNQWYNLDDNSVSRMDDTKQLKSSAAYVLFYKRREPTKKS